MSILIDIFIISGWAIYDIVVKKSSNSGVPATTYMKVRTFVRYQGRNARERGERKETKERKVEEKEERQRQRQREREREEKR